MFEVGSHVPQRQSAHFRYLHRIRTTPIKLGSADLFVERWLDTKKFFVHRKLIPAIGNGTVTKGYIVVVCVKGYVGVGLGVSEIQAISSQIPGLLLISVSIFEVNHV